MRFLSTLLNRRKSEPTCRVDPDAGIRATRTVVWGDDPHAPTWMRSKSWAAKAIQFPLSKRPSSFQLEIDEGVEVATPESVQKACSKRWDDIRDELNIAEEQAKPLRRFSFEESLASQSMLSSSPKDMDKFPRFETTHLCDYYDIFSDTASLEILEDSYIDYANMSWESELESDSSDFSRPPSSSERPGAPTPSHGHRRISTDYSVFTCPLSTPFPEFIDDSSETSSMISAINAGSTSDDDDPVTPGGSTFYQTSNILINPHIDGEIVTYSAIAGGRFVRERIRDGEVVEREVIEKGFI
ncbi:hypothetical protein NEOLI_002395 [Neolecta irregularis DAH-3]|uniref:Uncharacterized protein n=1 Tax=Neolecta irregularis (strain DAH-3) TaxID=1198029 RepID=A0A1U7LJB6_NEOID|nr:hypothetical protein NEOLI_002395 [Neolecta irregularis DAH-3]|eukprot:OLL22750.1 hypothetical protein NEOLI_002395 [Neolecta irregularis DAH-3]